MSDSLSSIPLSLQRVGAFVIFAECVFLIGWHVWQTSVVAEKAQAGPNLRRLAPLLTAAFLATWFAAATVVADAAHFPFSDNAARRPASAIVAFGPFLIALGLLFFSKSWRTLNAAFAPEKLVAIQSYRVAGGFFLFPFMTYGVLPPGFAWPAGIGDMATGLIAPFIAVAISRKWRGAFGWAVAWNIFGTLDLIVAPLSAINSQAKVLELYPLALVPLFIGPPLGILTHVYSLRNLIVNRRFLAL